MKYSLFLAMLIHFTCLEFLLGQSDTVNQDPTQNAKVSDFTQSNLVRFCAKCTMPRNGVNIESFSDVPEPSTIWLLCLTESNEEISRQLLLTDFQMDSIKKLNLRTAGGFDTTGYEKALLLLNDAQIRKLELAGLLIDGGPALRSRFLTNELNLDVICSKRISQDINAFRQNSILPAHRATFGGGRQNDFFIWNAVSDAVILNHQIVDRLDSNQKDRLVSLYIEAERESGELVGHFWHIFLPKQLDQGSEKTAVGKVQEQMLENTENPR
jgi:hypothetical protein